MYDELGLPIENELYDRITELAQGTGLEQHKVYLDALYEIAYSKTIEKGSEWNDTDIKNTIEEFIQNL